MHSRDRIRPRRRTVAVIAGTSCLLLALAACDPTSSGSAAAGTATAPTSSALGAPASRAPAAALMKTIRFPSVGTFFDRGSVRPHGTHHCTATVLASTDRNTVITAAHCIHGSAAGMMFAPGYHDGRAPYGMWKVTGAYVPPSWQRDVDPDSDYAVLRIAPKQIGGRSFEIADVVDAVHLGAAPPPRTRVTMVAYLKKNSGPTSCTGTVYDVAGYPTVRCAGFAAGSSGSPWLWTDPSGRLVVRGVIGGPKDGGCFPDVSNTSPFTAEVTSLVDRAERDQPPDHVRNSGVAKC